VLASAWNPTAFLLSTESKKTRTSTSEVGQQDDVLAERGPR
jgi:hypothetical protein